MVHVPAKVLRKYINAFSSYNAKTKRDGRTDRWTDRQTDGRTDRRTEGVAISHPGPPAPREIKNSIIKGGVLSVREYAKRNCKGTKIQEDGKPTSMEQQYKWMPAMDG